jgi:hypothetical protein
MMPKIQLHRICFWGRNAPSWKFVNPLILLSLAFLASPIYADEMLPVLKVGSDTYSNVLVTSVSVTDIYFTSNMGMANAKLKDLNPEMQKHFHYDPAKADAAEKKQAADKIQYHLQLLKQPPPRAAVDDPAEHGPAEAGQEVPCPQGDVEIMVFSPPSSRADDRHHFSPCREGETLPALRDTPTAGLVDAHKTT